MSYKMPRRREIRTIQPSAWIWTTNPNRMRFCSLMPVLVDSPFWEKMDISKVRELVAEIAASSAAIDLATKACYRRWGAGYLVWQVLTAD